MADVGYSASSNCRQSKLLGSCPEKLSLTLNWLSLVSNPLNCRTTCTLCSWHTAPWYLKNLLVCKGAWESRGRQEGDEQRQQVEKLGLEDDKAYDRKSSQGNYFPIHLHLPRTYCRGSGLWWFGAVSLTASWDSLLVSVQQHIHCSPRRPGLARSHLPAAWPTQHYASAAAKFVGWVWSGVFPSPPLSRNQPLGKLFSCATGHHGRWDLGSMTLLIYPSVGVIICLAPEVLGFTSSNRLRRLHPHHWHGLAGAQALFLSVMEQAPDQAMLRL